MSDFIFTTPFGNGAGSTEPPDSLAMDAQKKPSFRDMVMGCGSCETESGSPVLKDKLATIEYADGNPLKPMVRLADSVFEGLFAPWQDALVVKLLGKNLGFFTMKDRLTKIWKLTTSKRVAERKVARFQRNVTKKGFSYPVGPILLGLLIFVVVGSCLFQIIRTATSRGMA